MAIPGLNFWKWLSLLKPLEGFSGALPRSTEELCRKHGCSTASFYSWKKKFGDTSSDQAKLLRRLQRENERLLRLVGQQQFELEAMKDVLAKKR